MRLAFLGCVTNFPAGVVYMSVFNYRVYAQTRATGQRAMLAHSVGSCPASARSTSGMMVLLFVAATAPK